MRVTFKPRTYMVTFTGAGGNGRLNATLNGSPFTGGKVEHTEINFWEIIIVIE